MEFIAVFLLGGYEAILGYLSITFFFLKKLINYFIINGKYIIYIYHVYASLLAAVHDEIPDHFPYKGHQIISFPDVIDTYMSGIGYVAGEMSWFYGEKLQTLGVQASYTRCLSHDVGLFAISFLSFPPQKGCLIFIPHVMKIESLIILILKNICQNIRNFLSMCNRKKV